MARDGLIPEDADDADLTDRERAMAQQLVESLASESFDPTKYHDQYREQLLDLIERKAAGEEIIAEPESEAPAKVLDLVAALEASLAKASTAKDRHPSAAGRKVEVDDDEDDEEDAEEDEAPATRPEGDQGRQGDEEEGARQEGDARPNARRRRTAAGSAPVVLLVEPAAACTDQVPGTVAFELRARLETGDREDARSDGIAASVVPRQSARRSGRSGCASATSSWAQGAIRVRH